MIAWLALSAALAPAAGPAAPQLYGDRLLRDAARAHPSVAGLVIDTTQTGGSALRIGEEAEGKGASVPLRDAMGSEIGRLTVAPRAGRHVDAPTIAAELARHIYVARNLVEPDPYVPGATIAPRAQTLVERSLRHFPDLVTLALHVGAPGQPNTIVASSFGRIGKPGDGDDARVVRDGATLRETTNEGRRVAVELPLLDRKHRTIGALSTSFRVPEGREPVSGDHRAVAVRDELAASIPSIEWLLDAPQRR